MRLLMVVIFMPLLLACSPTDKTLGSKSSPTPPVGTVLVVEVVDGDTIKAKIAGTVATVRIIGLDTPETVDPRNPVQCFGREASAKAKELLGGQHVLLIPDRTQGERDRYDRLLRYIEKADGLDFGLWMIFNGFAHEYTYDKPYERQTAYKTAQKRASENALGFWSPSGCNGNTKQPAKKTS